MSNKAIILDNALFDNGSFECHNFWIADEEGCRMVDAAFINTLGLKELILERMEQGKRHLVVTSGLVYGGLQVLEIQWD